MDGSRKNIATESAAWPGGTEMVAIVALQPHARNARTHSRRQIKKIAASIERFGFVNPVLIDENNLIIAGHGRVAAARQLGWTEVPTLRIEHLNETEKRAYVLADNRLAEEAGWDQEMLAIELQGLIELDFSIELAGFDTAEADFILDAHAEANAPDRNIDDDIPPLPALRGCRNAARRSVAPRPASFTLRRRNYRRLLQKAARRRPRRADIHRSTVQPADRRSRLRSRQGAPPRVCDGLR